MNLNTVVLSCLPLFSGEDSFSIIASAAVIITVCICLTIFLITRLKIKAKEIEHTNKLKEADELHGKYYCRCNACEKCTCTKKDGGKENA